MKIATIGEKEGVLFYKWLRIRIHIPLSLVTRGATIRDSGDNRLVLALNIRHGLLNNLNFIK